MDFFFHTYGSVSQSKIFSVFFSQFLGHLWCARCYVRTLHQICITSSSTRNKYRPMQRSKIKRNENSNYYALSLLVIQQCFSRLLQPRKTLNFFFSKPIVALKTNVMMISDTLLHKPDECHRLDNYATWTKTQAAINSYFFFYSCINTHFPWSHHPRLLFEIKKQPIKKNSFLRRATRTFDTRYHIPIKICSLVEIDF